MRKTFLMCEPKFYGVEYVINPHMEGNVGKVNQSLAYNQWKNLHSIVSNLADVELIDQAPGLPDMVFTANAGLVFQDLSYFWLSRFSNPQRQGEERLFAGWFIANGFDVIDQTPLEVAFFEGAGDALVDSKGEHWVGYGMRSSEQAVEFIRKFFNNRFFGIRKFHSLELRDPRFYHLDTCFAPLSRGHILWYPDAFTLPSFWRVKAKTLPNMLINVDESDALHFACNVICIDNVVIMPTCSNLLKTKVQELGYEVMFVDLSEFIKAGGAAKCLTLEIR